MPTEPRRPDSTRAVRVPADLLGLFRSGMPDLIDQMIEVIRDEVPEYARPLTGAFGEQIREGVTTALEVFVDSLGTDQSDLDLRLYEGLGRFEMHEGRTLDSLQSAYRVGARVAWRAVSQAGQELGLAPTVLYRLAEAIFAYIDRLAAASVKGYTAEQSAQAGSLQARRYQLVELALRSPPPDSDELAGAADAVGWTVPSEVAVVAVDDDLDVIAGRMPAGVVAAAMSPGGLLLVADPDGPGRRERVAAGLVRGRAVVGPTVAVAEAARSAERARAAWTLHAAGRLGSGAVVRVDEVTVPLLLAGGDDGLAALAARLAPLTALTRTARERTTATLRAWLDAHGDVTATAELLGVHPQTVRYRLAGLAESWPGVLENPVARLELDLALRAQALGLLD